MVLHRLKRHIAKAAAAIVTALMITVLFVLQFVVFDSNPYFWKSIAFWLNLVIMLVILISCAEIYWRFGSKSGQNNDKYLNSAIEYSLRVNRIKNSNPNKVDDFYKFVDEKNEELFEQGRKEFLDKYGIRREDYYGTEENPGHNSFTKKELMALKKKTPVGEIEYYTKKQIKVILRANKGDFKYERINGTEILSGMTSKATRYNTHYNARENQLKFTTKNMAISIMVSMILAVLVLSLVETWDATALFLFFFRVFILAYRAVTSYSEGYNDIVETRRTVNNNRVNIIVMYVAVRNLEELFDGINEEIAQTKALYIEESSNG